MIGTILGTIGTVFLWIWTNIIWVLISLIFRFIFWFTTFRFVANRGEIQDEHDRREKKKGSNLSLKETGKVFIDDIKKTLPNTKTNSFDRKVKKEIDETKREFRSSKEVLRSKFRKKKKTKKAKSK